MSVEIETSGDVWTIIHNRPEARNAVNPKSAQALFEAFQAFEDGPAKVAVFWGAGDHFCAGYDLKFAAALSEPGAFAAEFGDLGFGVNSARALRAPMGPSRMELSKPVIGAIEGAAVAGGMELAMWCDIRVMAETAYMGVYCRRWGITLVDGGTVRLPRLVGQGRALEIALTGRKVEAEECLRIGLAEKLVAHGGARAAAEVMAHDIARFPQEAVRADRRSIHETHGMPLRAAMRLEWANGLEAIRNHGTSGAERFSAGAGRGGDFSRI